MASGGVLPDEQPASCPCLQTTLAQALRVLAERTDKRKLALAKLVPHVREELAQCGVDVAGSEVAAWFDGAERVLLEQRAAKLVVRKPSSADQIEELP